MTETEPTPNTTTSTTNGKASDSQETGKISTPKEKKKGDKEDKRMHSKEQPEAVAISSDEESTVELVIEGQVENVQGNVGTGPTAQSTRANVSLPPLEIDASLAEEIEQREQEVEVGDEAEVSVPTPEELATAVVTTPTPTSDHTYSITVSLPTPTPIHPTVSSSAPTQIPIYSTLTSTSQNSRNNCPQFRCDNAHHALRCWARPSPSNAYSTGSSRTIDDEHARPYLKSRGESLPAFQCPSGPYRNGVFEKESGGVQWQAR